MDLRLPPIHNEILRNQVWIHRSALNEQAFSRKSDSSFESNERLEFLGDAVLELASSIFLYQEFPSEPEGMLTALRSAIVKTTTLADMARKFEMGKHIQMSNGEEKTGGRENASILADTFEAYLGALFLDQGFEVVDSFLRIHLFPLATEIRALRLEKDDKSILQELLQAQKLPLPVYKPIKEEGKEHQKTFTIQLEVNGMVIAVEQGRNKQEAQQKCAQTALKKIRESGGLEFNTVQEVNQT